ncbi:unnamed protein product [Victoria cruziana]
MDVSILSWVSSSSSRLVCSPFTQNALLFRKHRSICIFPRSRCFKCMTSRNFSATSESPPREDNVRISGAFGGERQLSGMQRVVDVVPSSVRYAVSALVVVGSLAAGYAIGLRTRGTRATCIGGAVALGLIGGAAVSALNSAVPSAAVVSLHNKVAGCSNLGSLKREDIEKVARRYGVSKRNRAFNAELCDLYKRFVMSVLETGSDPLEGDEVGRIIKFKCTLGIDDPDAAKVHMELGRHVYGQRMEREGHDADMGHFPLLQKLVYVSSLVFGEASVSLLPWNQVLNVAIAQVEFPIQESERLYAEKLKSITLDVDANQLIELRTTQVAADLLREHIRERIEEKVTAALDMVKCRSRSEVSSLNDHLEEILSFNSLLTSLTNHPEVGRFPPGIGPLSLLGGKYDNDGKVDNGDLKLLCRSYLMQTFSNGYIEEKMLTALNNLKDIFGLRKSEAERIMFEVKSVFYLRRLSKAFSQGQLESAISKEDFLHKLCIELHFDEEEARKLHEEIYRQKLQLAVADGTLSEEDVAALLHLQVLLCIPQKTVDEAHSKICGSLFEKVVRDVITLGVDGSDDDLKAEIRKAFRALRLSRDASMAIASKTVRKTFLRYVKKSRAAGSGIEAAKELKKMVILKNIVVAEIISGIKEEFSFDSRRDEEDTSTWKNGEPEGESLQVQRNARLNEKPQATLVKTDQEEITLVADLSETERCDLYRTYLLHCISRKAAAVPFGPHNITKKGDIEYFILNQLGQILGMSSAEIAAVDRSLAEKAFREKAQVILADGQLTNERIQELKEVQKQFCLPSEFAQNVIRSMTTTEQLQ